MLMYSSPLSGKSGKTFNLRLTEAQSRATLREMGLKHPTPVSGNRFPSLAARFPNIFCASLFWACRAGAIRARLTACVSTLQAFFFALKQQKRITAI